MKNTAAKACVLLALGLVACGRSPQPVDLLQPGPRLVEAKAAGEGRDEVLRRGAEGLRLDDVLRRGFPAGPPGRLRFTLDVPKAARLIFACGLDPRFHDRPGVEFTVKVKRGDREDVVWTQVLDPIAHPEHRLWVPVDVDLASYAGAGPRARPRDARLRGDGRGRARVVGHAGGDHGRAQGPPRS